MGKMDKTRRTAFFRLLLLISLIGMTFGEALSQPASEEKEPQIRLGKVSFLTREIQSTSSILNVLEVHVELFNQSQKIAAPPDSIKLLITPKEVKFSGETPSGGFTLSPEETILSLPLSPRAGRVMMLGFLVPKMNLDSITFEIQVNPPEGEKKTATFNF